MQYILHDLLKLPLNERLEIIEKVISSIGYRDMELDIQTRIKQTLSSINQNIINPERKMMM